MGWSSKTIALFGSAIFVSGLLSYEVGRRSAKAPSPTKVRAKTDVTLDVGVTESRAALVTGWSSDEIVDGRTSVWSDGPEASIHQSLPEHQGSWLLLLDAKAARRELVERPTITVTANGFPVGALFVPSHWDVIPFVVPAGLFHSGQNDLRLKFEKTFQPSTEPGGDHRHLALLLDRVRWIPLPP